MPAGTESRQSGRTSRDIIALILFSSFVVVAYAVLVGSPSYWFHLLGPAAIAAVVAVSLVVLVDMSYPFSGDFAIPPDNFHTGVLETVLQYCRFREPESAADTGRSCCHDTSGSTAGSAA